MSEGQLLTPEQVAERLQVKPHTIQEWLRTGRLAGVKLGKLWRVRASDLEAFLSHYETRGASSPDIGGAASAQEHAARVDALTGKYAWVQTSVDEFCRRKQEEIDLEDRRQDGRKG